MNEHDVDTLQAQYISALDSKDWRAWLNCFSPQGRYFLKAADDVQGGRPLSLMHDDCFARLQDRITYITKVWAYEPYQTRHFFQRMQYQPFEDCVQARFHFTVYQSDVNGQANLLAVGVYEDEIVLTDEGVKFSEKKAIIDNWLLPRYLVYPL